MLHRFTYVVLVLMFAVFAFAQEKDSLKETKPQKTESKKMSKEESKTKDVVVMETSMGTMEIQLYPDKAPITVENFLSYIKDKFFDGTIFHRVIDNFMVQGGGFTKDLKQKPTKPTIIIESDNGLKNDLGTIAMARTPDPNSATSQFFINVKDNSFLNFRSKTPDGWGYCVFGKVIKGMDIVNKIKVVKTGTQNGMGDVPVEPVMIKKVYVQGEKSEKKAEEKKSE